MRVHLTYTLRPSISYSFRHKISGKTLTVLDKRFAAMGCLCVFRKRCELVRFRDVLSQVDKKKKIKNLICLVKRRID